MDWPMGYDGTDVQVWAESAASSYYSWPFLAWAAFQVGAETPLRGNGPWTGYGYFFYTRPHFLHEDL